MVLLRPVRPGGGVSEGVSEASGRPTCQVRARLSEGYDFRRDAFRYATRPRPSGRCGGQACLCFGVVSGEIRASSPFAGRAPRGFERDGGEDADKRGLGNRRTVLPWPLDFV